MCRVRLGLSEKRDILAKGVLRELLATEVFRAFKVPMDKQDIGERKEFRVSLEKWVNLESKVQSVLSENKACKVFRAQEV